CRRGALHRLGGEPYLSIPNFVFFAAKSMHTESRAMNAQWRLLRHFGFGENAAGRRVPSSKLNAGSFADHAAASIASDKIACPQRCTIGHFGTAGYFDGDAAL